MHKGTYEKPALVQEGDLKRITGTDAGWQSSIATAHNTKKHECHCGDGAHGCGCSHDHDAA